ncbi:hypothetical protein [Bradyrhizobium betae]|uniref:hypothetical protein n=1 Tax=Bradyrhizobium betae TaxID=244734 RepID=UPI00100FC8BB|nr:hypothetical protein [Bradyrhizobium betae]
MKWKSILAGRSKRTFSIPRQMGNEFAATTTPPASVRRVTAKCQLAGDIGDTTSKELSPGILP